MSKISQYPVVTSMNAGDYFLIDVTPITSNSTSIITKANAVPGNSQATFTTSGIVKQTVYNVFDYGAVGDNTHDDTSDIQSAIAAAHTAGGGVVWFPLGTYKLTSALTLYPNVSLQGVGAGASVLNQTTTSAHGITMTSGSTLAAQLSIQALGIEGPGSGTGNGINMSGAPLIYLSIRDVEVQSFGGTGVYLAGTVMTELARVTSATNGAHGFWIDGTSSFCTSTSFTNCYGNANPDAGFYIYKTTYCSMEGCGADSNGIGYLLSDCSSMSVDGCGAESSSGSGSYPGVSFKVIGSAMFGSTGVQLNACYSYDVHDIGYWVTGDATGIVLSACNDSSPHAGASYSLQVDSSATAETLMCTFAGSSNNTGAVSTAAEPTSAYSYLRYAYGNAFVATDKPLSVGTSQSNLFLTASSGTNYMESIGTNNTGGATLTLGTKSIGVEFVSWDGTTGDMTVPNATSLSSTLAVSGATTLSSTLGVSGATTITSNSADALAVGANGSTNPVLQVNASASTIKTGLAVTGAAAAGGLAIAVISSGAAENGTLDAKGTGTFGINTVGTTSGLVTLGNSTSNAGATVNGPLTATGFIKSTGATGVGYGTGAGGTVTQITSRTTGVTINKITGAITLVAGAGSATPFTMTVTNSTVAATDTVIVSQQSGTDAYEAVVSAVGAGSFKLTITDLTGTTNESPVFNFAVIKAVTS